MLCLSSQPLASRNMAKALKDSVQAMMGRNTAAGLCTEWMRAAQNMARRDCWRAGSTAPGGFHRESS